jgi:hypothetical protein
LLIEDHPEQEGEGVRGQEEICVFVTREMERLRGHRRIVAQIFAAGGHGALLERAES